MSTAPHRWPVARSPGWWPTTSSVPPGATASARRRHEVVHAAVGQVEEVRGHQVVGRLVAVGRRPAAQVGLAPGGAGRDAGADGRGVLRGPVQRDPGEVEPGDRPAALGQPDRVGTLARADVEGPARRQAGGLGHQLRVGVPAPDAGRSAYRSSQVSCSNIASSPLAVRHAPPAASSSARSALIIAPAAQPAGGRDDHLRRQVGDVARHPDARHRRERRSGRRARRCPTRSRPSPAPRPRRRGTPAPPSAAVKTGATTSTCARDDLAVGQPDAGEPVVLDERPRPPRRAPPRTPSAASRSAAASASGPGAPSSSITTSSLSWRNSSAWCSDIGPRHRMPIARSRTSQPWQ